VSTQLSSKWVVSVVCDKREVVAASGKESRSGRISGTLEAVSVAAVAKIDGAATRYSGRFWVTGKFGVVRLSLTTNSTVHTVKRSTRAGEVPGATPVAACHRLSSPVMASSWCPVVPEYFMCSAHCSLLTATVAASYLLAAPLELLTPVTHHPKLSKLQRSMKVLTARCAPPEYPQSHSRLQ
jgi:hypothetical protein